MTSPEPVPVPAEAELHKAITDHLDTMVLAGEIFPDYEVSNCVWHPDTESFSATVRMKLVLPLPKSN